MDDKKKGIGFGSLSDLASDLEDMDEAVPQARKASRSKTPRMISASAVPQARKASVSRRSLEAEVLDGDNGRFPVKGMFGIVGVVLVSWFVYDLYNGAESGNKKTSENSSLQSQGYNRPYNIPFSDRTSAAAQNAKLRYTRPSVGTNNLLSVSEIRWCLVHAIRIEETKYIIDANRNNAGVDALNGIIGDYNSRCGRYQYRQGAQQVAEREVEAHRSQIVAEAIRDARNLGNVQREPSAQDNIRMAQQLLAEREVEAHRSQIVAEAIRDARRLGNVQKEPRTQDNIRMAQQLLSDLGYDPGPVDGKYGSRTASAVRAFQRDAMIVQDGQIDHNLLSMLRGFKRLRVNN